MVPDVTDVGHGVSNGSRHVRRPWSRVVTVIPPEVFWSLHPGDRVRISGLRLRHRLGC